jgi:hypothetical protein
MTLTKEVRLLKLTPLLFELDETHPPRFALVLVTAPDEPAGRA